MKPHVLVADDEQPVADELASTLTSQYTVTVTYSGERAVEIIDEQTDVVLLDRRMPELSGDEVLNRIREQDHTCQVAMVTAVKPDVDIIEMPFDAYITKPVSADELLSTVRRLVQRSEFDSALREYTALVSKRSTLKQNYSEEELAQSQKFQELAANIEQLEAEVNRLTTDLPNEDLFDVIGSPPATAEFDGNTTST